MEYIVTIKEVHKVKMLIEADSPSHAVELIRDGEGEQIDSSDYESTLDPDTWTVELNETDEESEDDNN